MNSKSIREVDQLKKTYSGTEIAAMAILDLTRVIEQGFNQLNGILLELSDAISELDDEEEDGDE